MSDVIELLLGLSLLLYLISGIGLVVIAFKESAACGLMILFIPFYILYYGFSRWKGTRFFFILFLVSSIVVMVFMILGEQGSFNSYERPVEKPAGQGMPVDPINDQILEIYYLIEKKEYDEAAEILETLPSEDLSATQRDHKVRLERMIENNEYQAGDTE